MPDEVVEQILHAHAHRVRQQGFHALLRPAGTFDGKPAFQPQEENNGQREDQQLHSNVIRYGILLAFGANVQQAEQSQGRLCQQPVN